MHADVAGDFAIDILTVVDVPDKMWDGTVRVHVKLINHFFKEKRYHSIIAEIAEIVYHRGICDRGVQGSPNKRRVRWSIDAP